MVIGQQFFYIGFSTDGNNGFGFQSPDVEKQGKWKSLKTIIRIESIREFKNSNKETERFYSLLHIKLGWRCCVFSTSNKVTLEHRK